VAVRTIYVKFGGKSGLFKAVLIANRDKFISPQQMQTDTRPLRVIIGEYSEHFLTMITEPAALEVQRMVIAESKTDPELGNSFFDAGPRQSREMLAQFFARPDIRAQLRDDLPFELLPSFLLNCILGDQFSRFLFDPAAEPQAEIDARLRQRLELFYQSVLKPV
jgi:TetR/AcrR family transcriptional repressor of mexJK operon